MAISGCEKKGLLKRLWDWTAAWPHRKYNRRRWRGLKTGRWAHAPLLILVTCVHGFRDEQDAGRFRTIALTKRPLSSPTPADTVDRWPKTSTNSSLRQDLRDVPQIYKIC